MKKWSLLVLLIFVVMFGFQNCGGFQAFGPENNFSIASVYPYSAPPSYFYDAQLVAKESKGSGFNYQFIISVASVFDPDRVIDGEVAILDEAGNNFCSPLAFSSNRNSNHIEFLDCTNATEPDQLTVSVSIDGESQSLEVELDLSGL